MTFCFFILGKHPNDLTTTNIIDTPKIPLAPPYHQLPADLTTEGIRREAALVLEQADRHKSSTNDNIDSLPRPKTKRSSSSAAEITTNPKKFNSLPSRKKKSPSKPVKRSSSDAAAKKPSKRASILNFFSRKSDTNVAQSERDPRFEDSGGRRLVRSKSDVGSSAGRSDREERKLKKTLKDPNSSVKLPLSPIIENSQKEDYFEQQFNRERRKSDAITEREKHESGLGELLERSREKAELDGSLLTRNPISESIKDKILTLQSKSNENMHSSQQPAQKVPLTKGMTVNGMIKRLSMERFSPPPTINGPAFSYIRPNEGLTYAQLDHEQSYDRFNSLHRDERDARSHAREYKSAMREMRDMRSPDREFVRERPLNSYTSQSPANGHHNADYNGYRKRESLSPRRTSGGVTTIRISSPWQQLNTTRNLSDEDEGLGIETRKYFDEEYRKTSRSKSPSEPPIIPVIRSITPPLPEREPARYEKQRAYNSPLDDITNENEMDYRRSRLESNILTRRFGDNRFSTQPRPRSPELHAKSYQHSYLTQPRNRERSVPLQSHEAEPKSRYYQGKYHGDVRESHERDYRGDSRPAERFGGYSPEERGQFLSSSYEPRSLDSKLSATEQYRISPEQMKRQEWSRQTPQEQWQSSLKRDKLQQRSFDKGDSGIENDFRKESFNGDITTK